MNELIDEGIMAKFEKEGHSFLIRLWEENRENDDEESVWRGWVYHLQSEQKRFFKSIDEVTGIINSYLVQNLTLDQVFEPVQEETQ